MADIPTPDQIGSATVWFTSQAGIAATILAFVAAVEAIGFIWAVRRCEKFLKDANDSWIKASADMADAWAKRIDQMRLDVKEAFNQNDSLADKMVEALHSLKIEIARMSGRSDRG